jgi:replicative DNA helicase
MTSGWQRSDLIIIAARPSMGKTAFALACARNAALHPKNPAGVAIFSLEMSSQQLAQRMLTSEARVDAQAARTGRLRDDDWPRLARAAGKLSDAGIYIDDTPGLSVLELRAKCRRLKAEHDIGLVIVDYLQLMHGGSGGKNSNREQEIAHISRSLKALAKELDVPVIALSQLSRAVETRGGDKRPQLADLRESGSIEQDADVVAFIYRAERYGITVDENGNSTEGMAEILVGKQRNGPIGDVRLAFVHQFARFENLNTYYGGQAYGATPEADAGGDGFGGGAPGYGADDAPF